MTGLTYAEVKDRHRDLHKALDELFACFIVQNPDYMDEAGKPYTELPFRDLMGWSYSMSKDPSCHPEHDDSDYQPWLERAYESGWKRGFYPGVLIGLIVGLFIAYVALA